MTVVENDLLRRRAYVNGQCVDADSGETFAVCDDKGGVCRGGLELKYLAIGGLG